jgi:putative lipoic acid-binding regulatory protein
MTGTSSDKGAAGDGSGRSGTNGPGGEASPSLLQFPTAFPIKIMGRRVDGFVQTITNLVRQHAPDFDPSTIELRPSTMGNYLSVTATINATSREQLDALYRALTSHPLVSVVL